jgi:hypothetical protein
MKKPTPDSWSLLAQVVKLIDDMDDERAVLAAQNVIGDRLYIVQEARVDADHPRPKRAYTRKAKSDRTEPVVSIPQPAGSGGALAGPWKTAKTAIENIARSGKVPSSKAAFESGLAKWILALGMVNKEDQIEMADRLSVVNAMRDGMFDYNNGKILEPAS